MLCEVEECVHESHIPQFNLARPGPPIENDHPPDPGERRGRKEAQGVRCDLAILDPPYSPRQISECYQEAGIKCGMKETQNTALYSRVKNAMAEVLTDNAIVLSFGWNSAGMGQKHGFEQIEIMLVCHGGAHNDTICLAERKRPNLQGALL